VYRDSLWVNIYNRDIQAGDLICLKDGEVYFSIITHTVFKEVPADVVLISCSHPEGVCYFETANLDG
jgi:magnesium-transporting ATPase (P-type)